MTTYQILMLRYLALKRDYPHLKHEGHEPVQTSEDSGHCYNVSQADQRRRAEFEFYRPIEKPI